MTVFFFSYGNNNFEKKAHKNINQYQGLLLLSLSVQKSISEEWIQTKQKIIILNSAFDFVSVEISTSKFKNNMLDRCSSCWWTLELYD